MRKMPLPSPAEKAPTAVPVAVRMAGLPPIVAPSTVVLILGSFPGAASLAAHRYYAHPQNRFWPVLQAIWPEDGVWVSVSSYEKRSEWLLSKGLGVWDVYASCERAGSLDANIRNAVLNDFAEVAERCPRLDAVAHNGLASFGHAGEVKAALLQIQPGRSATISFHRLPSTSPANASSTFAAKVEAWRAAFAAHGLVQSATV